MVLHWGVVGDVGAVYREDTWEYTLNTLHTVNVEFFALYIFSRFSHFSNIRENIYNLKIYFCIPHRGNKI